MLISALFGEEHLPFSSDDPETKFNLLDSGGDSFR